MLLRTKMANPDLFPNFENLLQKKIFLIHLLPDLSLMDMTILKTIYLRKDKI